jgi:prepilin-type processing-associated H-X9-DG protein
VAIVVRCECGNVIQTRDENAGRRARCPACQRELIIPQPDVLPADELAEFHDHRPSGTSGKAIASLILGLCSPLGCVFTGLPAVILGMMGLNDISSSKNRLGGKGMATTGIVLGSLTFLIVPVAVLAALLLPAVQAAREAARRAQCTNNQKQIALAMHNFESTNGVFPPAAIFDPSGKPLLSWRVLILPYVEELSLYEQFHLDEPWDSPHNKPLAERIPPVYRCPSEPALTQGLTTYQVIVGPRSMFTGEPTGVSLSGVRDGMSSTLTVVEAASAVPWTKPEDLSLASTDPMLGVGSKHPGGFNVTMADGSVRFFKTSTGAQALRAMVTRDGRERVAAP